MPKVTVYNMSGAQVGEIELSEAVFGIQPNQVAVHAVIKNYLANQRQGTPIHPDPHRGPGRRQKALETEGHRPCAPGLNPRPPVEPWRHRARPQAPRLQLFPEQEGPQARPQVGLLLKGARERPGRR